MSKNRLAVKYPNLQKLFLAQYLNVYLKKRLVCNQLIPNELLINDNEGVLPLEK